MSMAPPLVVDTSVALKWFFDEPYSEQALRLLDAFREGSARVLAPDSIYPEFANAVWKRIASDRLDIEAGAVTITAFLALPIEITPSPLLLISAYRLALEHRHSVYDALFLALSLEAGADLMTADEALYRTMRRQFPRVRWLANFPNSSDLPM